MWKEVENTDEFILYTITHNKEEYIKECKELSLATYEYYNKTCDVIEDSETWHSLFETDEYCKYDCNDNYTNPLEYKGNFKRNIPKDNQYPLIALYNLGSNYISFIPLKGVIE